MSTDDVNWPPGPGSTKDQATGIGRVVGIVLDDLTGQNGLGDFLLQNASARVITHLPTGMLGVENPVLSKTAL